MSQPTLVERRRLAEFRRREVGPSIPTAPPPVTAPRRFFWREPFIAAYVAIGATLALAAALVVLGVDFSGIPHDLRALSAWFPR
jgi:hypothetical protein